ncbi:MAG: helix-turn-helix domain-containing protein [Clostridiales bacterium]|nr:helix-turn-helix domain-containing protein [Clostridiales bacterium]
MQKKEQHVSVRLMEKVRIAKGLSKLELTRRAELGPTTYGSWLRGYMPTIENANKVFCVLGITFTLGKKPAGTSDNPDEYIAGINGEKIGITWNDENPKKLLKRLNQLEERVEKLERKAE